MKTMMAVGLVFLMALQATAEVPASQMNYVFQDLYGHEAILSPAAETPAAVLFFFSKTCPVARRYVPKMNQTAANYRARGVQFIAVNVSPADSLDDVARFALEYHVAFPVVKDPRFDAVKALGISRTPEVTVLDQNFAKVYQGRIDDQYRLGGVKPAATRNELADALDAVLGGHPVPVSHVPAEGCVVTVPEDTVPQSDAAPESDETIYNVEWVASDGNEEKGSPARRVWNLDPARGAIGWMTALRVDGDFQSANIYYTEKGADTRHYIAGALLPGRPLRWKGGEAVRMPADTLLRLDTTGKNMRVPRVQMHITETAPDWEITCTGTSFAGDTGDVVALPMTILQHSPTPGQPRYISLNIPRYGTALTVDFRPNEGTSFGLLSLPAADPRQPGPHPVSEWPAALEASGSLRAILHRPDYLTWPQSGRVEPGAGTVTTMYTYWAVRP